MLKHDDAGRSLPGFIFAFVFDRVDLPTDCAIEPVLVLGLGLSPGMEREARGRRWSPLAWLIGVETASVWRTTEAGGGVAHAVLRNCSKSWCLAFCMRRAASVSLMSPAMRCRVARVRPGRKYCWGWCSDKSVSSGV